ncbi:MAG: hypothetical protein HQ542_01985 [Bacteroidia bacterium]|nr:hypothetical protein [Bacteroidia bacterium]
MIYANTRALFWTNWIRKQETAKEPGEGEYKEEFDDGNPTNQTDDMP